MNGKLVDVETEVPATNGVITNECKLGTIDLSMPNCSRNMPDVQLEILCDIIFADTKLTTVPWQNAAACFKADL